jgi:hypothetical protein
MDAKLLVNKDTGLLVNSISDRLDREGNKISVEVGTGVEYAPYQEFLPVEKGGKAFLTPALNRNKSKYPQIIADALRPEVN